MSDIDKPKRTTQNRVIAPFHDQPHYPRVGDWTDRAGNSNIEESLTQRLPGQLARFGHDQVRSVIGIAEALRRPHTHTRRYR